MSNYLGLLYELGRNAEAANRFAVNPDSEMSRWNLTKEEKATLRECSMQNFMVSKGLRQHHLTNSTIKSYQ